jgi:hypothetical protein
MKNLLQIQAQSHDIDIGAQFLLCLIILAGNQKANTPNQQFQQAHHEEQDTQ